MDIELDRKLDDRIKKVVTNYLQSSGFMDRKLTDTPTDDLQVVPRKYVNMNGLVTNRPKSSVATIGQSFFATDTNIPMRFTGSNWVNGIGSVVAGGL